MSTSFTTLPPSCFVGLPRLASSDIGAAPARPDAEDRARRDAVRQIVDEIERGGDRSLRRYAEAFDGLPPDAPLFVERDELAAARDALDAPTRALLERTAARIRRFAAAQLTSLASLDMEIEGGRAGHEVVPLERAGLYAPGGRYPLVSSVLMTAIPARVAEVEEVILATPRPGPLMLAAAAIAGVDRLLTVGGAQAIAALAVGTASLPAVDLVAGPGGSWVSEAKLAVSERVRIDTLAGPSELLVVADAEDADVDLIAVDLLAQAEHDPSARPMVVTLGTGVADALDAALERALADLPTAAVARAALSRGFIVELPADATTEAGALIDRIAPEHLELIGPRAESLAETVRHAGAVFRGAASAEVLGDYGAGPNHTLPTAQRARQSGGLSVLDFLRVRTWLDLEPGEELDALSRDAAALARCEGLEAHARSAECRQSRGD